MGMVWLGKLDRVIVLDLGSMVRIGDHGMCLGCVKGEG
jgi:hypothetical protein